ncbi:hypothetical protein EUTSA_v10012217mg [Eutrema salsugineum]|uniref:Uncharacterized protein n=1 Tax=Eutrema salsugineum TaxID=72664 RepID=V4KU18_EUTSA|nr:hypothetical protein EUTSA_v10012217mg [Eutrema salsugineum]
MISDSIPFELIVQILSRLPAKSIARFHCLPKLWGSMFHRPYFTELFLTRSSARPRLFFAMEKKDLLPQHQSPYEKSSSSSLAIAAEFHMKFPPENMSIYFSSVKVQDYYNKVPVISVICNPNTGRYETLPFLSRFRRAYSFFGFDPIDKQFKVLFMANMRGPDHHKILTLGTGEMKWRNIKCPLRHDNVSGGICINGVVYYLGDTSDVMTGFVIVCFDVRSEKFKFIYPESFCELINCELINYKGKLGVVYYDDYAGDALEFRLWVLEDSEKLVWSKYDFTLRDDMLLTHYVSILGMTVTGEIGFGDYHEALYGPSRVHVFVDDCSRLYAFADHVDDLSVNDAKLLKSSIS